MARATPSEGKIQTTSTQDGRRLAIIQKRDQPAATQYRKEAEIVKQTGYDPKADKVYACDPKIGAMLPRGTKVNLVIVANQEGTFEYFEVHRDLTERNIKAVYDGVLKPDLEAQNLVVKYAQGIELTPLEKTTMQERMTKSRIQVDPANPEKTFESAMDGFVVALKFGA